MPARPCLDRHPDPPKTASQCRICWLSVNDGRYQKLWGLPVTAADGPHHPGPARGGYMPLPCIHEGPVIEHANCGSEYKHVRDCEVHDRCTRGPNNGTVACCRDCPDRRLAPITTRHLAYHLLPVKGRWQSAVAQLTRRWSLFNGRKVIALMTGGSFARTNGGNVGWTFTLDSPDAVRAALPADAEVIELPNDPDRREMVSLLPLFSSLASAGPDSAIFYAHAKGVAQPEHSAVHRWAEILYETCLDHWPVVDRILARHPCAGSFRKLGRWFEKSNSDWHYSGTFWWMRADELYRRNWRTAEQEWWGAESYPSMVFDPNEAGVIFHTTDSVLNLYNGAFLQKTIEPLYEQWKRAQLFPNTPAEIRGGLPDSLNLGCGPFRAEGWCNADVIADETIRPDFVVPVDGPLPFAQWSFRRAFLGHVLEHVAWDKLPALLSEVQRVVRPGGEVLVVGPDTERAIARLEAEPGDAARSFLWGVLEDDRHRQNHAGDWNGARHQWNCYESRVVRLLDAAGFNEVRAVPLHPDQLGSWPIVDYSNPWQCAVLARVP